MIEKDIIKGHDRVEGGVRAWTKSSWVNGEDHAVGNETWEIFTKVEDVEKILKVDVKTQEQLIKADIRDLKKQLHKLWGTIKDVLDSRGYKIWKKSLDSGEYRRFRMLDILEGQGDDVTDFFTVVGEKEYNKFKDNRAKRVFQEYEAATEDYNKYVQMENELKKRELSLEENKDFEKQMKAVLKELKDGNS